MNNIQISAIIYLKAMNSMKKILDLVAFKMDRRTKDFSYAKEEIMNYVYNNLRDAFKELEKADIIEKCPCGANLRQGYQKCECRGSGYINKRDK